MLNQEQKQFAILERVRVLSKSAKLPPETAILKKATSRKIAYQADKK